MKHNYLIVPLFLSVSASLYADSAYYCPQNHRYITPGMTPDQVIAACGTPLSMQDSNKPILQKIPVQQLIYNNQGTSTAFYGVWNIPTGSGGTPLQVDVINNQIKAITVNNNDGNAFTVCGGSAIKVDDSVGRVYAACGTPDVVNNTYVNQVVPTAQKPVVWIYQPGPYQPPVSLTFVNGKLQSIDY